MNLQFNYMWMPEQLQILNLSTDFSYNIQAANLLSIQDLHCNFVARQLMFANYKKEKCLARFVQVVQ